MSEPARILIVDDEPNVLEGLVRTIGRAYRVQTASSGAEALKLLRESPPFSVVLTDMRMPGMDGVEFLMQARALAPRAVYMMLTGNQDQQTASDALNRGRIFRFLCKPCAREDLLAALQAGVQEQHAAQRERVLLEKTLAGSVQAMLQVLQLTRPKVFQRSARISRLARWIATRINHPEPWQVEIAAALAMIGCVALPDDLVDAALDTRAPLPPEDQRALARHPGIGQKLLAPIPRLGRIAAIVGNQNHDPETADLDAETAAGVALLRAAREIDARLNAKTVWCVAADEVSRLPETPANIAEALKGPPPDWLQGATGAVRVIHASEVRIGMVLQDDVRGVRGDLLIASGHPINDLLAERLHSYAKTGKISGEIRVIDPAARE